MDYARLIEGEIQFAPRKLSTIINNEAFTVYNPPPALLEFSGYFPVIYNDMPNDASEGYHYEQRYIFNDDEIIQEWVLTEDSDEISDAEALAIILGGDVADA